MTKTIDIRPEIAHKQWRHDYEKELKAKNEQIEKTKNDMIMIKMSDLRKALQSIHEYLARDGSFFYLPQYLETKILKQASKV